MTTIAWDGKTLAADRLVGCASRSITKIRRASNGALVGCSGSTFTDAEMFAWYDRGANVAEFPAGQRNEDKSSVLIAIERGGIVRLFDTTPYGAVYEDQFTAIGSGRDFALAAMHCGKSAREAVEVASLFDPHSGNGIDTLEF